MRGNEREGGRPKQQRNRTKTLISEICNASIHENCRENKKKIKGEQKNGGKVIKNQKKNCLILEINLKTKYRYNQRTWKGQREEELKYEKAFINASAG